MGSKKASKKAAAKPAVPKRKSKVGKLSRDTALKLIVSKRASVANKSKTLAIARARTRELDAAYREALKDYNEFVDEIRSGQKLLPLG